jgi:hypothetical protein
MMAEANLSAAPAAESDLLRDAAGTSGNAQRPTREDEIIDAVIQILEVDDWF